MQPCAHGSRCSGSQLLWHGYSRCAVGKACAGGCQPELGLATCNNLAQPASAACFHGHAAIQPDKAALQALDKEVGLMKVGLHQLCWLRADRLLSACLAKLPAADRLRLHCLALSAPPHAVALHILRHMFALPAGHEAPERASVHGRGAKSASHRDR